MARRRAQFLSFISVISILGIAVAVTALIAVLSVMNGFETELKARILDLGAHAVIEEFDGKLTHWEQLQPSAEQHPEVLAAAPFVDGQGMLVKGSRFEGVAVRGVLPQQEQRVSALHEKLTQGSLSELKAGDYGIVLGSKLAESLQVVPGDDVVLLIAKGVVTPVGVIPRKRRFTVTGIFHMDMTEYDENLAVIHMKDATTLYRMGTRVSGLRLKLLDLVQAPQVVKDVAIQLGTGFYVRDWTQERPNFFRSIRLTKSIMFIILSLIVAVAAFNIVSTLVMVVTDKQSDIAILRTIGATPGTIMRVFLVQGTLVGLVGTLLGLTFGLILANYAGPVVEWIEQTLNIELVSSQVYFISGLPSEIRPLDVVSICVVAFLLSVLSTVYPSWRASKVQPAEALRHD